RVELILPLNRDLFCRFYRHHRRHDRANQRAALAIQGLKRRDLFRIDIRRSSKRIFFRRRPRERTQTPVLQPIIVQRRDREAEHRYKSKEFQQIFHQLTFENVRPCCSTINRRKRLFSGHSSCGSISKIDIAVIRARFISWASFRRSPIFSTGKPLCAVPNKSPGPRSSQSASATSNPSLVFSSTANFAAASDDGSELSNMQYDLCSPRPTRPRS